MSDQDPKATGEETAANQFTLSSYEPVEVTLPKPNVPDAHINDQILQIAKRYATYDKVEDREIQPNDALYVSIEATENGEPFPGLSTEGRVFQLGQGHMPPAFEEQVSSMHVGETKTFDFEGPTMEMGEDGKPVMSSVTATVTVLEIRQESIPAITDVWVSENIPGAKTLPEFRDMIKQQMEMQLAGQFEQYKQFACASTLAQRLQEHIPDEIFEKGMSDSHMQFEMMLRQQNMTKEDFFKQQGIDEQQFGMQMLMQTREMLAQQLSLDAMANHLDLDVTDDEVDALFGGKTPEQTAAARKACEEAGQLGEARTAALRMKALKWTVDNAKIEYQD